jgi:uncharacterized small protein (DUF1192 family)
MGFFEKSKKFIKDSYEKGAKFGQDLNEIKAKSNESKIKVLQQKSRITQLQANIARSKAQKNKFSGQGGGLFGSSSGSGGGLNALLAPAPGPRQAHNNSLYGNNSGSGGGLMAVLGNAPKTHKKRLKSHKGKTIMIKL